MRKRSAGVLLPVSALPGPFGAGTFGPEAEAFLELLKEMGFSHWQVLPFQIPDYAFSPYTSVSAFAGNPLMIDLRALVDLGLLRKGEVETAFCVDGIYKAQYAQAIASKTRLLELAFSRLDEEWKAQIEAFADSNDWVRDFSLFMALRRANHGRPWQTWPKAQREYEAARQAFGELQSAMRYEQFVQFLFEQQWRGLKAQANGMGISVIGDMPIYLALDSADVWRNRDLFLLDADGYPREVAGVPPDAFSSEGQLWGNPLYDWERAEQTGFSWWIARFAHLLSWYDTLRIDHFRGFASYWAVPAGEASAKAGRWVKAKGTALFADLKRAIPDADLLAEDLGVAGEDVAQLLEETGFPGMRVMQFGFEAGPKDRHLPHTYEKNCVAYLGTHDNDTALGWLWGAKPAHRDFALRYCGYRGARWGDGGYESVSVRCMIETLLKSAADLAVLSFQDLCGFGSDTRLNIPGTALGNWTFRATPEMFRRIDRAYFYGLNEIYDRLAD